MVPVMSPVLVQRLIRAWNKVRLTLHELQVTRFADLTQDASVLGSGEKQIAVSAIAKMISEASCNRALPSII